MNYDNPTERGAKTVLMSDGTGYAVAVCDYTQPGGEVIRVATFMRVEDGGAIDVTLHEHTETLTWAPERPTETADYPPIDQWTGEWPIEEDGGNVRPD